MKTLLYILGKYWSKHKKSLFLLMFSGTLMTAVLCAELLMFRDAFGTSVEEALSVFGKYDLAIADVSETRDFIDKVTADKELKRGNVSVYGKMKADGARQDLVFGSADEAASELLNFRFESGGLPKKDGEAALTRTALNAFFWTGEVGDSIALNGREYTVVGIIDKQYDHRRLTGFSDLDANAVGMIPYPLPMIFVSDSGESAEYSIALFKGFDVDSENSDFYGILNEYNEAFGNDLYAEFVSSDKWLIEINRNLPTYSIDIRWTLIMAGIAAMIAVLSVFSVLKSVFADRQAHIGLLRRVGMSGRMINRMHAVECGIFIVIQTVLGLLLGCGGYLAVYFWRVKALGQRRVSGFSSDIPIDGRFPDPFWVSAAFSAAMTVLAYALIITASKYRPRQKVSKAKAGSLFSNFGAVFRQCGVTVLQTVSLSLICFGAVLGYMYFTDENKQSVNEKLYIYQDLGVPLTVGEFDMIETGIEEYYSCERQLRHGFEIDGAGTFTTVADNKGRGVSDEDISALDGITATGKLDQTYIVSEEELEAGIEPLLITDEAQRGDILEASSENAQSFFDDGQVGSRYLYNIQTSLADGNSIEAVSEYVIEGEINIGRINSGEEIVLVTTAFATCFKAGETLELASLLGCGGYGLADVTSAEVRIGAVVKLPRSAPAKMDKLTFYAVSGTADSGNSLSLLTTAAGANSLKLHNAAYTEVFSREKIKGSVFPSNAEMKRISRSSLRQEELLRRLRQYGEITRISLIMLILGFSAYFSGIGLKIRSRSYEIATLRSVGSPLSRIKRRLFFDNLKIPVIAAITAGAGIFAVKGVMRNRFEQLITMHSELDKMLAELSFGSEEYAAAQLNGLDAINKFSDRFFLQRAMWAVPTVIPVLIVFAAICAVTVLLTVLALRKHKGSISEIINAERRRQ